MAAVSQTLELRIANGQYESNVVNLSAGRFGFIIIPADSDLDTFQFNILEVYKGNDVPLTASAKTLTLGELCTFTDAEIAVLRCAGDVKISLTAPATKDEILYLRWKS